MITFDSRLLRDFLTEQKDFIVGSRMNKIQQPTRRELLFSLRNNGETKQFYINIYPQMYHVCFISDENYKKRHIEIPQKPPMFCMLLRKYLLNSRISKVNQPEGERILELFFETYNEIGDKIYLCLAIELMGKYSNVILYNTDTNIILGAAHNVGADKSQVREVYGQIPYVYPPKNNNNEALILRYEPIKYIKNIYKKSVNETIDNYYSYHISKGKFSSLKNSYLIELNKDISKLNKSLHEMNLQLSKYSNEDKYRLWGDLLMANLYNLKDYSKSASVYDYENDKQVSISLDSLKTIKENANKFYKKYNKSKSAKVKLSELVEKNNQKKDYLEQIIYSLNFAQTFEDLDDLTEEISILKGNNKTFNMKKKVNITKITDDNFTIYIGKNNKQNDYIVSKLSDEDDLWFHTKDCPGSHVLLKAQNVTDELILKCANLAKQYSTGANSSKIGVIYTKRKYLRKPPKSNLGYVTYKNEKEIIIN